MHLSFFQVKNKITLNLLYSLEFKKKIYISEQQMIQETNMSCLKAMIVDFGTCL